MTDATLLYLSAWWLYLLQWSTIPVLALAQYRGSRLWRSL